MPDVERRIEHGVTPERVKTTRLQDGLHERSIVGGQVVVKAWPDWSSE
jgi:hypothetical protein